MLEQKPLANAVFLAVLQSNYSDIRHIHAYRAFRTALKKILLTPLAPRYIFFCAQARARSCVCMCMCMCLCMRACVCVCVCAVSYTHLTLPTRR